LMDFVSSGAVAVFGLLSFKFYNNVIMIETAQQIS
jgi:hypothetical protein